MAGSTYKIIELVGTSDKTWEEAAKVAVETAGKSLKDLVGKKEVATQLGQISRLGQLSKDRPIGAKSFSSRGYRAIGR